MPLDPTLVTAALHAGRTPDPTHGAICAPIVQSTTFVQPAVGVDRGFTYSRSSNPTVAALEASLGALEDAEAVAFGTGMAAITALCLAHLRAGDRVLHSSVVYGGTVRLLRQVLGRFGVRAESVDTSDVAALREALKEPAALLIVETPANPTLTLTDVSAVADLCRAHGVLLAVDNTFLTPVLQRPFDLGADLVLYSTTKYFDGHNATVGGAVLGRDPALVEPLRFVSNAVGFAQKPFEAWLTLQGIKTLPLRMERHCANATVVARWLERHPAIAHVAFPGLASFAQRALAERQQDGPGGMVAFTVRGGVSAGVSLLNSLQLCSLAENLGAAETLVTHPASMTHADVPRADRLAAGLSDGLVRLSVGLEDPSDLIADLDRALHVARAA